MVKKKKKSKRKKRWIPAPLPASFMLIAILGFLISAFWVFPMSYNWGLAFLIFFTLMFIAAVISMTRAPPLPKYKK